MRYSELQELVRSPRLTSLKRRDIGAELETCEKTSDLDKASGIS